MADNEDVRRLIRAFYNREIDDYSMYIEGFGGFFISRTKDGMVIGYADKNMRLGIDDHVTVFFDEHGLKGLHRKVVDAETDVYMKYGSDYFRSPKGVKKLIQDMQKRAGTSLPIKLLLIVIYRAMNWAFEEIRPRSIRVLENSEAKKLRMKPPCIYVKLGYIDRMLFPMYGKSILLQNRIHRSRFGKRPSEIFAEQHYPGSQITKHPKKRKKS